VGNLSFYTTADMLMEVFEEFGEVRDCYIPEDPVNGNSRGFGFITMDKDAAASSIDSLDGCELDGRIINVNEAKPRAAKKYESDEKEKESSGDDLGP
jgi:RNA recognition motif-containing protein